MPTKKEIAAAKAAKKAEDKRIAAEKKAATKNGKVEHRHISELNSTDRNALEAILRKDATAVDETELAILNARIAYLTSDEREKYDL